MRWLILAFAAIPAAAAWATLVFLGTANGWWHERIAPAGDSQAFADAVGLALEGGAGLAAFRLLEGGKVMAEHYQWRRSTVGADTPLPAGTLSMWVTAWGVMALVDAGRLDLDAPVSRYPTRWRLPAEPFDPDEVTVRRLLSHTAGLTDGLGYGGFPPGTPVQSLEESLTHAADALPGVDGRVRVGIPPGSEWRYSGGGYALLQLLIEQVTGQPFAQYMQSAVLDPLGMHDSSFAADAVERSEIYDRDGRVAPRYRFAAPAAAGLVTTVTDLTRFLAAQRPGADGAPAGRGILRPETVALTREPHASTMGTDVWGLGQMLYAGNGQGGFVVGHDGRGPPNLNTSARLDPANGDGIVLLVSGQSTLAGELAGEWVLWHTGKLDVATFYSAIGPMVGRVASGWGVIALTVVVVGWLTNRSSAARRHHHAAASRQEPP